MKTVVLVTVTMLNTFSDGDMVNTMPVKTFTGETPMTECMREVLAIRHDLDFAKELAKRHGVHLIQQRRMYFDCVSVP